MHTTTNREHPTEAREEVCPVEACHCALVDVLQLSVVIPGAHAHERRITFENGQRGAEIREEVRRHVEIVFDDDHGRGVGKHLEDLMGVAIRSGREKKRVEDESISKKIDFSTLAFILSS